MDSNFLEQLRSIPAGRNKLLTFYDQTISQTATQLRWKFYREAAPPYEFARWTLVDDGGAVIVVRLDLITPGKWLTTKYDEGAEYDVFLAHWRRKFQDIGASVGMPQAVIEELMPYAQQSAPEQTGKRPGRHTLPEDEIITRLAWRLWADEMIEKGEVRYLTDALAELRTHGCSLSYKQIQAEGNSRLTRADNALKAAAKERMNALKAEKKEKKKIA